MEELLRRFCRRRFWSGWTERRRPSRKAGKNVIIVEKDPHPGGASLNSGTIPSKSLREAILDLTDFYERSFYGKTGIDPRNVDQRSQLPAEYRPRRTAQNADAAV